MKRRVWNLLRPSPRQLGVLLSLVGACSGGAVGDPVTGNFGGGPALGAAGASGANPTPPGNTMNPVGAAGTGSMDDPQPPGGNSNGIVPPASGACSDARVEPRAVLVAPRQYVNMLRDLIGQTAVSEQDAAASSELLFDTIDRPRVTTSMLDRFDQMAESATQTLRGKTATFLNCPNLMDTACVRSSLERFAHRAYKRPVAPEEMTALMALRDMGTQLIADQGESGAIAALQAILVAPSTLYRTEFQSPAQNMSRKLTAHERAAALAAFLLDSVPDDALLAAADDGSLMTPAGLQTQVDRLLALPRVRQHLTQVVLTSFNVTRIFSTPKDAALFPNYTAMLQNSMYEETRRFVDDVLWTRNAPLGELMTSKKSFIDGNLAKLYGMAAPSQPAQFTQMDLPPERSGLLTQASVLSVLSRTDKNSVVARGLYVRGTIMCLEKIPGPPQSVQAQVMMQLGAAASQKELAAYRAMTSPCLGCHSQFDRFGLLLEAYDPIGKYLPQSAEPVDFTGLADFKGTVNDVGQLTALMAQDAVFEQCFSDRTLSYSLSIASDSASLCLKPASGTLNRNATMRDLILSVVQSPAWTDRTQLEP
jgi:Protein of unknown function (DUF1592)/Protein of unknown function (DUF1588)/Protein of unknown function (DUF1595)